MAHRDRAGQGVADARGTARSVQAVPQDDARAVAGAHAGASTGTRYLAGSRLPAAPTDQRHRAGVLPGSWNASLKSHRSPTGRPICAGTWLHAEAPYLSSHFRAGQISTSTASTCAASPQMQPRWKRCVQLVDRDLGEALGQVFVRQDLHARHQSARPLTMTKQIETAMESEIQTAAVDEPGDQAAGAGEAARDRQQDRLSGQVARLQLASTSSATTSAATCSARLTFESHRAAGQDRQAGRPQRVGHDAADGERLLRPADERHQLPGGRAAAAAVRSEDGRRAELRQHRRTIGHELTHGFDDEGRQFDAKGNLHDWWTKAGRRASSRSAPTACRTNTRSTPSSTTSRSTAS